MGVTAWRSPRHNSYSHAIVNSRRRAAGQVAVVLFSDFLQMDDTANNGKTIDGEIKT